jgi:hypothetical protein
MLLTCGYALAWIDPCQIRRSASADGSLTMIICEPSFGRLRQGVVTGLDLRLASLQASSQVGTRFTGVSLSTLCSLRSWPCIGHGERSS